MRKLRGIWRAILEEFGQSDKKMEIARKLIEYGLRVGEDGEIYLDNIRIPYTSIAKALNADRRTVKETVTRILKNNHLKWIFTKIHPAGPFLKDAAKILNLRVLTIEVYRDQPGILAHVSSVLARENLNILQVIAEYPDLFENPKLYVILEGNVKGEIIEEIMKHGAIKSVKID